MCERRRVSEEEEEEEADARLCSRAWQGRRVTVNRRASARSASSQSKVERLGARATKTQAS